MEVPLTIKHSKEDIPFFTMPKIRLSVLLNIEYRTALDEECRIVDDWIKNKRCKCSKEKGIQEKKFSLDCKHLNKKIDSNKIITDSRKKIERMSSALNYRNFAKVFRRGVNATDSAVGDKDAN